MRFDRLKTYREIGAKYSLSPERVRQVLFPLAPKNSSDSILKNVQFRYEKKFRGTVKADDLIEDIKALREPNRSKESVMKRNIVVKYLYNELDLTFMEIASLMKRDHTTIMHAYYSEEN